MSILPIHLAVELRNKMLSRLKAASLDSTHKRSAYGRFHDLYLKVHDNVRYSGSQLYIRKCNFTTIYNMSISPYKYAQKMFPHLDHCMH